MNISSSAPAALPLSTPGLAWCLPALLAVLLPTVIALNEPPSVTYYNPALAALGWGVWLCWLGWTWRNHPPALSARSLPMAALWLLAVVQVLAALWALWESPLPRGLAWMGAGLMMAAAVCAQAGWWCASQEAFSDRQRQAFFLALMAAGAIGMLIAIIQVFAPGWTDGQWLARPTVPGRAVGNLRQPNHFSSMLVMAMAACVWLGASRQAPARAMAVLTANEVMTQVACCELAPRLPAMVGSETLAMVVSSTCMNEAIARPTVHSATLGGRNPEAAPGAAGAPGAPGAAGACADMADLSSPWPAAAGCPG